jgi:peptide/nickel transport system substrate-binding protein/oligopeptide transport system substrate-binding protein
VGIQVLDDQTLEVRLNSPASFFPSMLCHHSFAPIHPSMVNVKDWSGNSPISNGPFYLKEMDADHILLVKNEYYWERGQVILNRITMKLTEDEKRASEYWNSGEARWISGGVNLDSLRDLSGIQMNAMFATHYFFLRSGEKPWDDYRIRRALILALPLEDLRGNYILPAKTLIYPIPGYPAVQGIGEGDREEAVRLLAEAGFPGGMGLPGLEIRISPSEDSQRIALAMAEAWTYLGLKVRVEVVPFEQYFQSLKREDYEVGSSTWIGDFADPYTFLQMWRRDSNLNDADYNDPDYEALLEQSMGEEGEVRWKTLAEAEGILLDRGTVLPLYHTPAFNIINTDEIGGWYKNVLDIHPFKYLEFKSYRPLPGVVEGSGDLQGRLVSGKR